MVDCKRCGALPGPVQTSGTLYLAPPLGHTASRARSALRAAGIPLEEPSPNLISARVAEGSLARLAEGLATALSRSELRDTRSLIVAEGEQPSFAALSAMEPLSTLVARVRGDRLLRMVRECRLTCHFQPIVRADDPSRTFAHECLLRGVETDGSLVPPGEIYEVARAADLLFPVDREARLTAIRQAARHGLDAPDSCLFVNFNPSSIYDPTFCLMSTVAAIRGTRFRPEQLVFEVVESDKIEDIDHLVKIVTYYRSSGFRVALDDLGSGYASLSLLGTLRPDFVKLDMNLIRGVDLDPYRASIATKLLEMARKLGIATVAEGIETEGEWRWAREHGADYVQGYLFARPSATPPSVRVPHDFGAEPVRAVG